jgi:predicted molibdopterin-dependent oxidoreductase YjgC
VDSGATYADAASVFQEITAVVPFYEGLSHARLQDGGIPWPCRTGGPGRCDGLATLEMMKNPLEFALPS